MTRDLILILLGFAGGAVAGCFIIELLLRATPLRKPAG